MPGIKFDQLDPETRKRILQELREQMGEEPAPSAMTKEAEQNSGAAREVAAAETLPARSEVRKTPVATILAIIFILGFIYYGYSSGAGSLSGGASTDGTPPELVIESPQEGISVQAMAPEVWFAGRTEPGAVVIIETEGMTQELAVDQNGKFGQSINLLQMLEKALRANAGSLGLAVVPGKTGWHILRLTATDAANNEAAKEIKFFFNDPAEKVPRGYYAVHPYGIYPYHGFGDLCSFLQNFSLPRGYERGVFDCSESSAMLEWALQTAGFDAYIAGGPTPWAPKQGSHAWVMVKTGQNWIAVEATTFTGKAGFFENLWAWFQGRTRGVVYQGDAGYQNYYSGYTELYPDIYQAVRTNYDDYNWWEGRWGFK